MSNVRRSLLALCLALAAEVTAFAQTCPDGQSITADTAGHCCWGGQAWSKSRASCVGVPQCPSSMDARGEGCAPRVAACREGQLVGERTAGHCCWPGQSWSEPANNCVGVPLCPPGFLGDGPGCVKSAPVPVLGGEPPPPSMSAPPPPPAPPQDPNGWGAWGAPPAPAHQRRQVSYDGGPIPKGARLESKPLLALAIPGAAVFGGLWIISAIVGLAYLELSVANPRDCNTPSTNGYLAVPLIGGALAVSKFHDAYPSCSANASGIAYADVVLQSLGLAALIVGLVVHRKVLVFDQAKRSGASWALLPGGASSPLGLTVGARF